MPDEILIALSAGFSRRGVHVYGKRHETSVGNPVCGFGFSFCPSEWSLSHQREDGWRILNIGPLLLFFHRDVEGSYHHDKEKADEIRGGLHLYMSVAGFMLFAMRYSPSSPQFGITATFYRERWKFVFERDELGAAVQFWPIAFFVGHSDGEKSSSVLMMEPENA